LETRTLRGSKRGKALDRSCETPVARGDHRAGEGFFSFSSTDASGGFG
jgi:hypothetical protein